jgi:alpha-glucosidase
MIAIHKAHQAFRTGSLILLGSDYQYLAYGRFTGEEQFVILINNNSAVRTVKQPVWAAGIPQNCEMNRILITADEGYSAQPIRYPVNEGRLEVRLPAHGAAIFQRL